MDNKYIALTFDDGPTLQITDQVLDILEENGVVASFFLIGQQVTPETEYLVRRAYNMGCTIENHSWTHPFMTKLTEEQIVDEISRTTKMITDLVGEAPKFFRPPYIDYDQKMYDNIDLTFISGHGCLDWEPDVSAQRRIEMVLNDAKPGNIVLLHDMENNVNTVEALKVIIPELKNRGYEFVTIRGLFEKSGVTPGRNCNYDGANEIRNNYT